jgi:uncharacterized protein YjbI with pentapeptide repeats
MTEELTSRSAHGCVVMVVGLQLIVILLALGMVASAYSKAPMWQYALGKRDFHRLSLPFYARLEGVVLAGADLSGANLSATNSRRANLSGANLSEANLSFADLRSANLSSANLSGAQLYSANLGAANLSGATVTASQLHTTTSLEGAILPDGTKWECSARDFDLCPSKLDEHVLR